VSAIEIKLKSIGYVDSAKLRLPINGTVYNSCGLVQGEGRDRCGYCGAEINLVAPKYGLTVVTKMKMSLINLIDLDMMKINYVNVATRIQMDTICN
jgi:hypothetical protein